MSGGDGRRLTPDRASVERIVHEHISLVIESGVHSGTSVVVEGAPGIGKSHLTREVLAMAQDRATILSLQGVQGRRLEPFAGAAQLALDLAPGGDVADAAFDAVDELCASGPVLLCADDAHDLDAATLTLLRRLVWASRNIPLALLVTTRPSASRALLASLVDQADVHLRLPPMDPMRVERLAYDRTGHWPGATFNEILAGAAGNPLYVGELIRAYQNAGALVETGPDELDARFELDWRSSGLPGVVRAHLGQADPATLELVAALAVWGADIGVADLEQLVPDDEPPLAERVGRAVGSGLVWQDSGGRIGFTHDVFREITYAELEAPEREEWHRRAAAVLTEGGYRPSLVAEHLLRAASGATPDAETIAALQEAVSATRDHAPEVTADLLDDVAAVGADVPDEILLDHVEALYWRGRGEHAEALVRDRIGGVEDLAIAARLQALLITSLATRGDAEGALAVVERTAAVPGLPATTRNRLRAVRGWVLAQAGRPLPAAELDTMLAEYVASGDVEAQANHPTIVAMSAFVDGRIDDAVAALGANESLAPVAGSVLARSTALIVPATLQLAVSGPRDAAVELERARRLADAGEARYLDPILGSMAGIIAFVAGDWDDAAAELDVALETADEIGTGWISQPVGVRAYIEAHRGSPRAARARLDAFRHRDLPLHFGHDRPRWAELAVLEAEGSVDRATTLARTVWAGVRAHRGRFAADVTTDLTRIALAAMDRRLVEQIAEEVTEACSPDIAGLVLGMIEADPDRIEEAVVELAAHGRGTVEASAWEELACAAAAAGDRDRATTALETALGRYQAMGATTDQDRTRARTRALGLRRSSRDSHRTERTGWASLTATEERIAALVREGLTNREIGSRLFVSPRTVQTHVSHILRKTGLRSRVEIAGSVEG